MAKTDLMIGIGAEYKGKGAFKQAETATEKLTKSVKNLSIAVGAAFSTRAIVNFARASVRASLESSAQQERLARLLTVTNDASEQQIAVLTRQSKALEQLGVVSAGSITQVQSQLATFDLQILTINRLTPAILDYVTAEKGAAATADDFKAATNGLAQALNGNFASLTKTGFVLDDVTKELIANGTESERAAALVKVLDSTYKGFNRSLRDTPTGQFQILANAADNARVIIGDGLTEAMVSAFGSGDIERATTNMDKFSRVVADIIKGLGTMAGAVINLRVESEQLTSSDFMGVQRGARTPFDPMSMKAPDLTAPFMKLVRAREKADKERDKREKDRLAREKKMTAEQRQQNALKKASAVLDQADKVMNMDLIQNTAALMGKVTADETLRLKLQQAILLGNADSAGNLAQQLLASQLAAMKLSSSNPLGGFSDALKAALDGVRSLRDELAKLGAAKVPVNTLIPIPVPGSVLPPSFGAPQTGGGQGTPGTSFLDLDYIDDFNFRNKATGARTELVITIDPTAAQYGIGVASVNNSANGNSNNYSTIQSFQGGVSF
jgi:hypothetical protein